MRCLFHPRPCPAPLTCSPRSTAEERLYWEQWLLDVSALPPPPPEYEEGNVFAASSLRAQRRQRVQVGAEGAGRGFGLARIRGDVQACLGFKRALAKGAAERPAAPPLLPARMPPQAALQECLTLIVEKGEPYRIKIKCHALQPAQPPAWLQL